MTLDAKIAAFELVLIVEALEMRRGNVSQAAKDLGLNHRTMWRKIRLHSIDYEGIRNRGSTRI